MSDLEKYLKSLAGADKNKMLVDYGTGVELHAESTINYEESGNLLIIKREKGDAKNATADISVISGNLNGVYPGAILHADSNLMDGQPNVITGPELVRKPLLVGLDIFGNTQEPAEVKIPSQNNVMKAINQMVKAWCDEKHTAAAQTEFNIVTAYDEKYLEVKTGIKGFADMFKVDCAGISEGKKTEVLVVVRQIYYTARLEAQTASMLYGDSVTKEDLENYDVNKNNPLAAMVTSMDFGRLIVIKFSSTNTKDNLESKVKTALFGTGSDSNATYEQILENVDYSVFVLGGKTTTVAELISKDYTIEEIRSIIASDTDFTSDSAAFPISYATNFIDDGSRAIITRSTEYVKTTVSRRGEIHFKTDTGSLYVTKHQKVWGRPIIDIDSEGQLKLGDWECLMDAGDGDLEKNLPGKYAELGYEFDITWGTYWPYSDVFWTADKPPAENVLIDMGGACRTASIKIYVNGDRVFSDSNCDGHKSRFGSKS